MSLKAFHILFISLAVLMILGCAGWVLLSYFHSGGAGQLVFAIAGFAGAIALAGYEFWFITKKAKRI